MMSQHQTLAFADSEEGTAVGYNYRPDPTRDAVLMNADASLARFFERPIQTHSIVWTPGQGSPFTLNIQPWTLFFSNPRVINRITNFALLRANLHVRFVINGNGFYYGRLMADYAPMYIYDDVTGYPTLIADNIMQASQRPKVFIDPSCSCSEELYLPFVWYKDALNPVSSDWDGLGRLFIRELQGLKHANGATQPLTVNIFMWATEVMMSMPTSADSSSLVAQAGEFVPQAGKKDEYGTGPVSRVASSVASVASALSVLPPLAPYARATEIAARGAASLATVMGLSRPADIAPLTAMRPTYSSALAPADAGDTPQKLTMDSKQEITIDPNVIGIDLPDELSVAHLAAKESWLTSFPWTTAATAGTLLWNARVTPCVSRYTSPNYFIPACHFVVHPFAVWRGKMRYRFQIVASAYHKGRLRIVWDPAYIQTLEANVQMTHIADISTDRDVVVEIDWGQPLHFLKTKSLTNSTNTFATSAYGAIDTGSNGVVGVYVMNDLATPNSTVNNDISVNVYVSMLDAQVAQPADRDQTETNTYSWVPQSGESGDAVLDGGNDPGCEECEPDMVAGNDSATPNDMAVYYGESVLSLRQLVKRYVRHSSILIPAPFASTETYWRAVLPDFPPYYGYNSTAMHTTTAGGFRVNYVSSLWLHYLTLAFVAVKGSQRSKYVIHPATPGAVTAVTVERGITSLSLPTAATTLPTTSQSNFARNAFTRGRGMMGAAITFPQVQPVLEVEFPWYKDVRFDEARSVNMASSTIALPQALSHSIEVVQAPGAAQSSIDRYVAVGEDFALHWFMGCPPISILTQPA